MTRTRTQTALNKLVGMVATVQGELEYLQRLAAQDQPEVAKIRGQVLAVSRRIAELETSRDALYETLRLFDPGIDPTDIRTTDDWLAHYGRAKGRAAQIKYLRELVGAGKAEVK